LQNMRGRKLVFQRERDRDRVRPGGVDEKLKPPRLDGVEVRIGGQREQARILLRPNALSGAGAEALIVAMDEPEGLPRLDDAQPIEPLALGFAIVLGAEEIVRSVGGDKDRLGTARYPAPVFLEITETKQIAADRGRRQQASDDLDVEIVGLAERHIERGT